MRNSRDSFAFFDMDLGLRRTLVEAYWLWCFFKIRVLFIVDGLHLSWFHLTHKFSLCLRSVFMT
jgi:hypothetical protein